jgi:hypothetical protein
MSGQDSTAQRERDSPVRLELAVALLGAEDLAKGVHVKGRAVLVAAEELVEERRREPGLEDHPAAHVDPADLQVERLGPPVVRARHGLVVRRKVQKGRIVLWVGRLCRRRRRRLCRRRRLGDRLGSQTGAQQRQQLQQHLAVSRVSLLDRWTLQTRLSNGGLPTDRFMAPSQPVCRFSRSFALCRLRNPHRQR